MRKNRSEVGKHSILSRKAVSEEQERGSAAHLWFSTERSFRGVKRCPPFYDLLSNFAATLLFFVLLCLPRIVAADVIADFSHGGIHVAVDQANSSERAYRVLVSSSDENVQRTTLFTLVDPPRIVIDVPGIPSKTSRKVDLNDPHLSSVRVGVHPDKTRLVIDLKTPLLPEASVDKVKRDSAEISLLFRGEDPTSIELSPRNKPTQSAEREGKNDLLSREMLQGGMLTGRKLPDEDVKTGKKEERSAKSIPHSPAPSPSRDPQQTDASSSLSGSPPLAGPSVEKSARTERDARTAASSSGTGAPPPVIRIVGATRLSTEEGEKAANGTAVLALPPRDGALPNERPTAKAPTGGNAEKAREKPPTLNGLYFKTTNRRSRFALLVDVTDLRDYKLSRPKSDSYELLLSGTRLADSHLTLPRFPPDGFDGFQAVAAVQRGENTIVKIFVEEGLRLAPFRAEGQLWIEISE